MSRIVSQTCSLKDGKDGPTCLGQLTLPSSWWPSVTPILKKRPEETKTLNKNTADAKTKQPKVLVEVKYSVYETREQSCDEIKGKIKVCFRYV